MRPLYLIAVVGTRLITVLSTLLISYLLSPQSFGYYTLVVTNALLMQMLFGAWLTSIANRVLATDHTLDREAMSAIASGFVLITCAGAIVLLGYSIAVTAHGFRWVLVAVLAFALIFYDTTLAIQNAAGNEVAYARLAMSRNCLAFALSIVFILAGAGFPGAVAGQILGTIIPVVATPSIIRLWVTVRPSFSAVATLRRHLSLGISGAAALGIYILANAPSRNIMEHTVGAANVGIWALCSDLFYGPLAVVANAYGLSQVRLLYLAAQAKDENLLAREARGLVEFTLAVTLPYAIGGAFFAPKIVALVFSPAQTANATIVVVPAVLQGAALLVLYSLASVALARRRFGLILAMVSTTAGAATLAVWSGGTLERMAWASSLASICSVALWLAWNAAKGYVCPRKAELGKLLVASIILAGVAAFGGHLLAFSGGWVISLLLAGGAFVVTALMLRLRGLLDALPSSLHTWLPAACVQDVPMMANRILLLRSLPLERDSRSTKMMAEYKRHGHVTAALVWSRGDAVQDRDDTIVCKVPGGYGQKLRGLAARIQWMIFMARQMITRRRDYDVIHTVDFDTAFISVPLGRLLGKTVIYDAFDSIGAILESGPLAKVLAILERMWMRSSSIVIFPDPIRLEQYGIAITPSITFISNIPDTHERPPEPIIAKNDAPLRIVYIGTLEAQHRGLEYIPDICRMLSSKIEFVVGGTGSLHDFFVEQEKHVGNLRYIGHQTYPQALKEMADSDILYGPYLLSTPAHRYASPNKMYEHLVLGRPLLTNTGTPPAALVEDAQSGFLFDGSRDGLFILLDSLDRTQCRAAGVRARQIWDERFAMLRAEQLERFFTLLHSESV